MYSLGDQPLVPFDRAHGDTRKKSKKLKCAVWVSSRLRRPAGLTVTLNKSIKKNKFIFNISDLR